MRFLTFFAVLVALVSAGMASDEMPLADLVKRSLNSIGNEQTREAAKNRLVEGTLEFRILNGGSGRQDGKEVFISEGDKLVSLLKLPNPDYHGERFVTDGRKILVAEMKPGIYSTLGQFILSNNEIITDGLWGGTLSTAWPLAHLEEHRAKLKYQGLRKKDGRELYRVDYIAAKHTDMEIQLYFEPETFRHVMTVYSLTISPPIARTDQATARQQETRYLLEERFSDFKTVDGLTLPERWAIQFTSDIPRVSISGRTRFGQANSTITEFDVNATNISHNIALDPKNFEVK